MKRHTILALAAAATVAGGSGAAMGQAFTLQHTNSINLSTLFNATSGYGNIGLSVAFDGTNAYVGGYNNTATAANVGIVKVGNVLSASPASAGVASTQVGTTGLRGYDALASDGTHLYAMHDSGVAGTSFIQKLDPNFAEVWKTLSPGGQRPFAMAIDPVGDGTTRAVGFLSQGHGRRLALNDSDGSLLYTVSGGANPGGIINSSPVLGTSWRALAFDAAGNIAMAEDSGVAYGVRQSANVWTDLAGTANQTTRSVFKSAAANNVGNGLALLEGLAANPVLVFSPRVAGSGAATAGVVLTDSLGGTTTVNSGEIQLRNRDGSPAGLLQAALRGNEDGIGGVFANEVKNFAVGTDANGLPVLIATSALENRLDVYQMEPTYVGDADATWAGGTWLAGVIPNSATLNARFAATTAARTITVDAGRTTKNLKIDSPNAYTFVGGTLNVDAPAGQNGNVQVLQGTHSVQNPLSLAKTTVFNVAGGAGLGVTGGVVGSGGVSKVGVGTMTLGGTNTIAGALGLTGGTLEVAGTLGGVTRVNASAGPGAPATLNVTGTVALAANGTDAGTSRISADTTVTIGAGGRIDLADNDAVWDYTATSPIDAIRGLLLTGRAGGAWNGAGGINSSAAAAAGGATGIGYIEAATLGVTTFSGLEVGTTSVLLKYTYAGDANFDGQIDADDYAAIDKGRARAVANAHWVDGDFNYDGTVSAADYLLIDTAFGQQTGVLSPDFLAARQAEFGDAYVAQLVAAVPEPATLGVIGLAASIWLSGRRRQQA
jgi:hypothetical protein